MRPANGDYYTNAMFPGLLVDGSDSYRDPRSPEDIAKSMGKVHILKARRRITRAESHPRTSEIDAIENPFDTPLFKWRGDGKQRKPAQRRKAAIKRIRA